MADRAFDVTMPEFADVLNQYGIKVAPPPAQDAIAPMPRNPAQMGEGWNQGVRSVAGGVVDTLAAPGRAAQGRYAVKPTVPGLWSEEDEFRQQQAQGQQVIDVGGMTIDLAGGGTTFAKAGQAGIFGGKLAKTANLEKLAEAEKLHARGFDPDIIRQHTGWFRGADGKWRFEISDARSTVNPHVGVAKDETRPLDHLFEHEDLFKAYPELKDMAVRRSEPPKTGYYGRSEIGIPAVASPEDRSILLHELQHAVQQKEGFAKGTNPHALLPLAKTEVAKQYNAVIGAPRAQELIKKNLAGELTAAETAELNAIYAASDKLNVYRIADEAYRRHAGEVESRAVEARKDFTPEQIRQTPPWKSEDRPREKQIVRPYSNDPNTPAASAPDDFIGKITSGKLPGVSVGRPQQATPAPKNANRPIAEGENMQELVADEMWHSSLLGSKQYGQGAAGERYQRYIQEMGDRGIGASLGSKDPAEVWSAVKVWEDRKPKALSLSPAEQELGLRQMKHMEDLLQPGGAYHGDVYKDRRSKKFHADRQKLRENYNSLRQEFGLERVDSPGWSDPEWAWKFFGDKTPAYRTTTSADLPRLLELARKDKTHSLSTKTSTDVAQGLLKEFDVPEISTALQEHGIIPKPRKP